MITESDQWAKLVEGSMIECHIAYRQTFFVLEGNTNPNEINVDRSYHKHWSDGLRIPRCTTGYYLSETASREFPENIIKWFVIDLSGDLYVIGLNDVTWGNNWHIPKRAQ